MESRPDLARWIVDYWNSGEYQARVAQIASRETLSEPAEIAMIAALIDHLKPNRVLEIGSFFGQTAIAMAEAVSANGVGRFDTIDPFGAHRMPGIIERWPEGARSVTTFSPVYSMEFFSKLEAKRERLDLVYVDGNHFFEYALFDIHRAAADLNPGGAIVVDNVEDEGVRLALQVFCGHNRAWRLFHGGRIFSADQVAAGFDVDYVGKYHWGVLLAPAGFQVGGGGIEGRGAFKTRPAVRGIRFAFAEVPRRVDLKLNFIHIARVPDFHLTGTKTIFDRRVLRQTVEAGQTEAVFEFSPPISLDAPDNLQFAYRFALTVGRLADYVLLSATEPHAVLT